MTDIAPRTVSKWDAPSRSDLFGREPFVDTIVKTIESSEEGFNLGVSARWGEGKSSILEQLKPKLETLNYKVLKFEPWKYTQDQISIKRKFILDIYAQLGKKHDETEFYSATEYEKELSPEKYSDIFAKKIGLFFRFAAPTAVVFVFGLVLFQKWSGVDINITQIFLSNLFVPVLAGLLPIVTKLTEVNIKQHIPKIESAEQFEKRFNEAIEEIMKGENPPKRVIIFVDDLDRCNHTEVEQVLTALFTFFNNKKCTYVITADHTVIRRYISQFLQLSDETREDGSVDIKKTNELRQKEATEYLKKIFQINFILPKITSDLLENWVRDLLGANPVIDFHNPYAKDYLVNLILNNFQGNPRKIKHFVRTLAFQLEAINEKISRLTDQSGEEWKNLHKVKRSPELLAKILIIQDRFPDFYESITSEPKLLQKREEGEIADDNKDLQNLLAQEPKFFNSVTREDDFKTIDPYYFLYFSGSTGYVENNAVDPAEVKAKAKAADFEGLTKIISGLTDEPRNAQFEHIKKEFDVPQIQPPEKANIVRSLFHTVSLIEQPTLRLQKLKEIFNSKRKYEVQFVSLQSVDFSKIIPIADAAVADKLLSEAPFTDPKLQLQVLNGFVSKQTLVDKVIADKFISVIAAGLKRNDASSQAYLDLVRKVEPKIFAFADLIQQVMIGTYPKAADPLRQNIFDTLVTFKNILTPPRSQEFEATVFEIVKTAPIGTAVALIGNIPDKINKNSFDVTRLCGSIRDRLASIGSHGELEQLTNIVVHPNIRKEIGDGNLNELIHSLIVILDDKDAAKRAYIRGKLPELLAYSTDKKGALRQIVQSIAHSGIAEGSQTMAKVQGMSDFWSAQPDLKKEFAKELKASAKKASDDAVKELMIKSSNELVPPPEPKKPLEEKKTEVQGETK